MMPGPVKVQHRDAFVKAVAAALRSRCRVPPAARVLVAVSGGADSVALLRALALLAPLNQWRLDLSVGHVQHHLRDEAEGDAAFVADMAKSLNLPFLRADLSLAETKGNLEGHARQQRYAALVTMAHAIDARFIATAHHGDDQLETLLMRLMRGASVRGLRGMRWRRHAPLAATAQPSTEGGARLGKLTDGTLLIRPMLALDRSEVMRFLGGLGQAFRDDHTNADINRVRARLRRDVLPVLRELKPDVAARSAAIADHLHKVSRVLTDAIDVAADRVVITGASRTLDRTDARTLRRIVLTGLLRRLLIDAGAKADRLGGRALEPVVRAIHDTTGGQRFFDFSGGVRLKITRNEIVVDGAASP